MFELVQVGSNTYYIDCPAKIGVYKISDNEVYLIDSGSDKDAGRKIRKILDRMASQGYKLLTQCRSHRRQQPSPGDKRVVKFSPRG